MQANMTSFHARLQFCIWKEH